MKGSTIKRGNTWTAYWFTTDPATGKRRQHSKGGFRTKNDAQRHLNGIIDKVERGEWKPDKKMTVEQLLAEWLAAKRSEGLRENTTAMYGNVIDGWLLPHVGKLKLDQLTPASGQRLVETLKTDDGSRLNRGALSSRSVQLAVQVLKAATRWALETGLVGRDPLVGFRRPRASGSPAATGAWIVGEARRFLASVETDRMRAAWWLLLGRGLRRGELAGLKWSAVDLDAGVIRIIETRVVVKSKATASTPKTDAGRRAVKLDAVLVAELRRHRQIVDLERHVAGEAWTDTGYVFVDQLGQPYRPELISRNFTRLARTTGLRPIRLHDLRHTAASLMLAAGESPKVVAEILGHSSPIITQVVYQHLMPGQTDAAGERLTGLLAAT
ncbi:MAG TPA: tyrosine-type recombinase/integrase [Acidimicrobiales bacterium]